MMSTNFYASGLLNLFQTLLGKPRALYLLVLPTISIIIASTSIFCLNLSAAASLPTSLILHDVKREKIENWESHDKPAKRRYRGVQEYTIHTDISLEGTLKIKESCDYVRMYVGVAFGFPVEIEIEAL